MECPIPLAGLTAFATYFAVSIVLLAAFVFLYSLVTPYHEFALIAGGNVAAACSLGGSLAGFAMPLASAVAHSVDLIDMVVWGAIALIVQILTFLALRFCYPAILSDIPADRVARGIFLGVISMVVGLLNAACMTY
ncbi:MAG: DUF350 domain-containing protein [Thermodesulfobacteriota bacterium]